MNMVSMRCGKKNPMAELMEAVSGWRSNYLTFLQGQEFCRARGDKSIERTWWREISRIKNRRLFFPRHILPAHLVHCIVLQVDKRAAADRTTAGLVFTLIRILPFADGAIIHGCSTMIFYQFIRPLFPWASSFSGRYIILLRY
jgi:hypothetical protein